MEKEVKVVVSNANTRFKKMHKIQQPHTFHWRKCKNGHVVLGGEDTEMNEKSEDWKDHAFSQHLRFSTFKFLPLNEKITFNRCTKVQTQPKLTEYLYSFYVTEYLQKKFMNWERGLFCLVS